MDSSLVYLVQTDTSVGFSSSNDEKLSSIKQRPKSQKILQTISSFKILKQKARIPKKFRKNIRNAKKTTFIYPNNLSFRVIEKSSLYYDFIKKFECIYSTSANLSKEKYDSYFAHKNSDIIVKNSLSYNELSPSFIKRVYKTKIKKIR